MKDNFNVIIDDTHYFHHFCISIKTFLDETNENTANLKMNSHSIRIVTLDSYMCSPIHGLDVMYSEFRGSSISQVPVLRLFGSIPTGEKICMHIHGVFPYLYIPYDGSEDANSLMYKIAANIDKAVNISLNQASSTVQHVYKITLVQGIPMYGYHNKEHQFFKIYLYNPLILRKVTALLMNESTLGKLYQPHEAHLSFTLQFMIDYNLHGMSNMILSKAKYRQGSNNVSLDPLDLLPSSVSKISVCELEGDCLADDILNREEVASGNIGANPGISALWADEQQRRKNKGVNSQMENFLELTRVNVPPTSSHLMFKQALRERLAVFLNEKNVLAKLNSSVYPAETPSNIRIQNAFTLDSQTSDSFSDSTQLSNSSLNETLAETNNMSITLDEDVQRLLQVLNELEKEANERNEEDSILTQLTKEDQDDKEIEENQLDFSMSVEDPVTPTKVFPEKCCERDSDDDLWDTTLVPQLDGCCDESVEEFQNESLQNSEMHRLGASIKLNIRRLTKVLYIRLIRLQRDMPDLDIDYLPNDSVILEEKPLSTVVPNPFIPIIKTRNQIKEKVRYPILNKRKIRAKRRKLTRKEKKEREIKKTIVEVKRFENRIKKLKRQDQLAAILKKLKKKENELVLFLQKNRQPRFRVISKDNVKPLLTSRCISENETSGVKTLNDIIVKMNHYIEPTLYLTVKYPNRCCYLYNYNSNFFPDVLRIPRKICGVYNQEDYEKFIKQNAFGANWFLNEKYNRGINKEEMLYPEVILHTEDETLDAIENKQLSYINEPDLVLQISRHADEEILKIVEDIREQLKMHMRLLFSSSFPKQYKSEFLPVEDKIIPSLIRKSIRIENRQKQLLLSLDGAIDSDSSSEEEKEERNYKRKLRSAISESRYKSLKVTLDKSPRRLNRVDKEEPPVKDLTSFTKTKEKKTLPISSPNQVCDTNVKRQLFDKEINPVLNTTLVEEKLVCSYSPISVTNTLYKNILRPKPDVLAVKEFSDTNEDSRDNFHKESILEDASSSSTIFNTDSENYEKSFFNSEIKNASHSFTVAETYDKNTNYKAKEGCSKFITPSSQHSSQDNVQLSQNVSSNSGSDLLKPYQQNQIETIPNFLIDNVEVLENVFSQGSKETPARSFIGTSHVIIEPKVSAPTRKDVVKSLDNLKMPHVLNEAPYYSCVEDVTGSVEVGFNTLKIRSKTTAHLPDFESQTDSLNSFRKAQLEQLPSDIKITKSNINTVLLSYCRDRDCIITPLKKPPDLKKINDWLAQKSKKTTTPEKRNERVKIHVPLSPGAKTDDEIMELSLTLSPSTPRSSQTSSENAATSSKTPTKSTSPVFGNECKKRKKDIRNRILSKSLRSSISLSQENSNTNSGQITGVTMSNSYLNRSVQNLQNARAIIEHQNLTVLVMEIHVRTRGDLKPDPAYDSMRAIFYSILHDVPEPNPKGRCVKGVIVINNLPLSPGVSITPLLDGCGVDCDITYVDSEDNLIKEFLKIIDYWDPDIFAGYEIELLSWGYLIERGYILGMNLKPLLGKIKQENCKTRNDDSLDELKLTGRILLDVWRLMRHEIALQSYTFESLAYHILHKRLPYYSIKDLSLWWDHRTHLHRHRTVKYYITRVGTILELFDKLDFLGRTSELARLFGIQFFEVLSRGSQFRVESMMLRLAKPLNYIAVSPSVQQRANMKAPEYIALVMEPESKLYNDPVIVLDFQSLYPSIIIAYNYCFTTCIGRIEKLGKSGPFEFGATQLRVSRTRLKKLLERNQLNFSPCGIGFVKKEVRDGILPRMLREILDTRLMVKNSMKENKNNSVLQKVLHNRQLGLKLIANVTYGYTAANFSGRMPAVEVGDSVVSKGRETLQRAVEMVDNTPEWGSRVVYGDTDSLFVLVPGRTKEHAFEIGKKIAEAVTNDNPDPMKLKLEKVYQPCILQTKKRYVGYMYETSDQKDPVYEAKGIETVRRDGCPAVSKMLEKCLRILFETNDVSLVKKYVLKQFHKIIAGRVSIQDLTFAKEYRGAAGYRPSACVPALELAKKWTAVDKRNEPRSGERVPYVIVNGPPGLPLIRMVRSPRDLLDDASLKPNAIYYITRVIIPAINRCFNLIGADLHTWFNQMPRKKIQYFANSMSPKKKSTISQYFSTSSCVCCEQQCQAGLCENCSDKPQETVFTLMEKMRMWEFNHQNMVKICHTCTSSVYEEVRCTSLDCPVYYRRMQTSRDEQQTTFIRQLLSSNSFINCA